ncbi:MAG: hypothetical protein QOC63_2078 [Mycobacterium sp.]|jgi:hypothetical protein|nr:hypothetical protein [Mycobacterium sp.]
MRGEVANWADIFIVAGTVLTVISGLSVLSSVLDLCHAAVDAQFGAGYEAAVIGG